jgi:hypothetical protein
MSLDSIIAALIGLMQAAPGLGHLYDYERMFIDPKQAHAVFGIPDQTVERGWSVRSWQWSTTGHAEERMGLSGEIVRLTHHLTLRGYWEHNDAYKSEVVFRDTVLALCALLRDPHAIADEADLILLPQVPDQGFVEIGGTYRCHHALITLDAQEVLDTGDTDDWLMLIPAALRSAEGR